MSEARFYHYTASTGKWVMYTKQENIDKEVFIATVHQCLTNKLPLTLRSKTSATIIPNSMLADTLIEVDE